MTDESIKIEKRKKLRSMLIVAGVVLLVVLVAVIKDLTADRQWFGREPVLSQLEEYRAAGKPVVVFFHSPDCTSCKKVQASLDEVYPEFQDSLVLLDVDVTNKRERDFVDQIGVQTTPTLLLMDAAGNERLIVGEISTADVRAELTALVGGAP